MKKSKTEYSLELLNDEVARPPHFDVIDDGGQLGALRPAREGDLAQAQRLYARDVQLRDALEKWQIRDLSSSRKNIMLFR